MSKMPSFFSFLFFVFLIGNVAAQDTRQAESARQRLEKALLTRDLELARKLLPQAKLTGRDLTLAQASVLAPLARARAMIELAEAKDSGSHGVTALVAGLSALLEYQGRTHLLGWEEEDVDHAYAFDPKEFFGATEETEDEDPKATPEIRELLDSYAARITAIEAKDPSPKTRTSLTEAHWMLETARIVRVEPGPLRISGAEGIPVPAPLAEELRYRFYPWSMTRPCLRLHRDGKPKTIAEGTLGKADHQRRVPPPPPGVYLLQLTSQTTGWSRVRCVLISDLELTSLIMARHVVVMASMGGKPTGGVELTLRDEDDEGYETVQLTARSNALGIAHFEIEGPLTRRNSTLRADKDGHRAWQQLGQVEQDLELTSGTEAHLQCDRPLYRPGELVQGRFIVFRNELDKSGVLTQHPLREQPIRMEFTLPSSKRINLRGWTDPHGVFGFSFRIPVGTEGGGVTCDTWLPAAGSHRDYPFEIGAFRRATTLLSIEGPSESTVDIDKLSIQLQASYANGSPAAGLRVQVKGGFRHHEDSLDAVLDGKGRLTLPLAFTELRPVGAGTLYLSASLHSPEGKLVQASHRIRLKGDGSKAKVSERRHWTPDGHIILPRKRSRAGSKIPIRFEGKPNATHLFVAVRDRVLVARPLTLDASGKASLQLQTQARDWPSLRLFMVTRNSDGWRGPAAVQLGLARPNPPLALSVAGLAKSYGPGQQVDLTVLAQDAGGKPAKACVCVAVVDERIFDATSRRQSQAESSLRPWLRQPSGAASLPRDFDDPWQVIGRMVTSGWLNVPDGSYFYSNSWRSHPVGGSPGGAGKSGRGSNLTVIRKNFRPTAFFVPTVMTDAQGRAKIAFTLPDQLTTWRCTVVAVTPTGMARTAKVWFDTRKDGAAELILPRYLRQGDSLRIPLLHDQGVAVQSTAAGALRIVSPNTAKRHALVLQAVQPGPSALQLEARLAGKVSDRIEYELGVLPDTVPRTSSRSFAVSKRMRLQDQQIAGARQRLILYGNRQALLRHAAEYLGDYPHGCVEQICSRMLPLFLGQRLDTLLDAAEVEQREADRGRKIQEGFALLRRRLVSPSRGFRWWTEALVDARMSALAITTLTVAQRGGIDPADFNLVIQPGKGELLELAETLADQLGVLADEPLPTDAPTETPVQTPADEDEPETKKREVRLAEAELIIACLRYKPNLAQHKAAIRMLVTAPQDLPPGMLARAGLALQAAGETTLARQVLTRILEGKRPLSQAQSRFPGESQVSRLAQTLELLIRVAPKNPARARLITRLLALSRDGRFGQTYGTACALTALLLDLKGRAPMAAASAREISVWVDGKQQRHVLAPNRRRALTLDIQGQSIELDPGEGSPLHVLLETTIQEPANRHQGWKEPLVVQRFLRRSSNGFVDDKGLTEIGTAATTRDVLEVEIRVQSPERLEYLSLACPIPAGWEVAEKGDFGILHDDEAIAAIPVLEAGKVQSYSVVLRSAMAGEVSWPPARASCMYDPGLSGASKGRRIIVKLAEPLPATTNIAPLFSKASPNYRPAIIEVVETEPEPSQLIKAWRAWLNLADESCFEDYIRTERSATLPLTLRESAAELDRCLDGILSKKDLAGSIGDLATLLGQSAAHVTVDEWESGGAPGLYCKFFTERCARIADRLLPKLVEASRVWTAESEALVHAFVEWSEEPLARRGILGQGRAAAASRDIRDMETFVEAIDGVEPWPQLSQLLWDCCSSPRKELKQVALRALPESAWKRLGENELRWLTQGSIYEEEVEGLATCGEVGEKLLLEALAQGRFYDPDGLVQTLGPGFAGRLPLPLVLQLGNEDLSLHLLTNPRFSDAELASHLRKPLGMEVRALLFRALMARGATRLTFDDKDAFTPWLKLAQAAWRGDEKAAARIFEEGRETELPYELDLLLSRSLLQHYRADNFVGWGDLLEDADARACLARFDTESIRKLVVEDYFDSYYLLPATALGPLASELLDSALTSSKAGERLLPLFGRSAPLKSYLEICLRNQCSPGTGARIAEQFYELTGFPLEYRGSNGALLRFEATDPQHRDEAFYRRARSPLPDTTPEPRAHLLRKRVGLR